MTIHHVTDATFKEELKKDGFTIANFWAPWCAPCQIFAPVLEAFAKENKERVKIVKVNVDENVEISSLFQIMSIPATILFKDGKPIRKEVGVLSSEHLKKWVAE